MNSTDFVFTILFIMTCACGKNPGSTQNASEKNHRTNNQEEPCIDPSKIDRDMMCIELWEPVCGCDGKTYSNTCYAEREGVTSWTDGECPE
jgi:hypothetical protein